MDTSAYLDNSKEATSLYAQLREAQAEVARLQAALKKACEAIDSLDDDALGMANVGNRYQWPIKSELLTYLRAVLDETLSITPAVTNGDSSKQPQCGHPPAAIVSSDEGTQYCAWCEEVANLQEIIASWKRSEKLIHKETDYLEDVIKKIHELTDPFAAAIRSAEEAQE